MTIGLPKPRLKNCERLWAEERGDFRWLEDEKKEHAIRVKYDWLECLNTDSEFF